jgi:hypothetical protein
MRIPIKFLRGWNVYQAGEIVRKDEELAAQLVQRGIAQFMDAKYATAGAKLKHIQGAPETRHIAGPGATKAEAKASVEKALGREIATQTGPKPDKVVDVATNEQKGPMAAAGSPTVKAKGPRKPRGPSKKAKPKK